MEILASCILSFVISILVAQIVSAHNFRTIEKYVLDVVNYAKKAMYEFVESKTRTMEDWKGNIVMKEVLPNGRKKVEGVINSEKIKQRMHEKRVTQKELADALGLKISSVSQKLNGKRTFYLHEAVKVCEVLEIPPEEFASYFNGR